MFEPDKAAEEREARVERDLVGLMEQHGVKHLSELPREAKRESERVARDAPNVSVRLMFAKRRAAVRSSEPR